MSINLIRAEIQNDPLARGYSGMTNEQVAVSLNTKNRQVDRSETPSSELFEAIVPAEWAALSAAEKNLLGQILAMGQVNLKGPNTRAALVNMFGAGTQTRANLVAMQKSTISRAEEIGIGDIVRPGEVAHARSQ